MSESESLFSKGKSLLSFLRDFAKLRRLRIPSYRPNDDILWFANLPTERSECLSPFLEVTQIMPLHKLWDSVAAEAGLFDTVIIDEASQSGLEALILLMLAKRIIIVGDDKQNSPEAVGIHEDDIGRLTRKHLEAFRFRALFRPDTSLFDHAVRGFPSTVSLREHFRCVPEIIRFSNELCYTDSPLIPLRQAPPHRLAPLQAVHVVGASCEGEGQRIRNRTEAEALVEQVLNCIEDESYEGKTMGVVVLQGHGQAELIERILAAKLEPKVIQERKLRCGIPPTFQGDQRDVMFLSLVTAPNVRTAALTSGMYVRRFNVAMSRARDQVWLFHSVQQSDLSPQDLRRRLLALCSEPGARDNSQTRRGAGSTGAGGETKAKNTW